MSKRNKNQQMARLEMTSAVDDCMNWMLLLVLALLPLLVRAVSIDLVAPGIYPALIGTGVHGELFTYYRWILLLIAAVILMALLFYKILVLKYEISPSYINVPLLLLAFFILLSGLAAEYKGIAWIGLYNQREGTLTYLAYLALFFVAANTRIKPWFARWAGGILIGVILLNTLLMLLSAAGQDITSVPLFRNLFVPAAMQASMTGGVKALLSNPNYSSGLGAALFVFMLTYVLWSSGLRKRLIYGLGALGALAMVLVSLSSSGAATIVLVLPLIGAVAWRSPDRKKIMVTGGGVLLLFALLAAVITWQFRTDDGQPGGLFTAILQNEYLQMTGSDYKPSEVPVPAAEGELFALPAPNTSAGTGRTYIWGHVLNLIPARPLLGHGMDTLAYYFPQNDVNMIAGVGRYGTLITKAHNFYLAVAYGAGIPALLALLGLFLLHFYHTGKRLMAAPCDENSIFPAALFLLFCAFAVQWLFNDSVIGAAPIFWLLMGAGASLNRKS